MSDNKILSFEEFVNQGSAGETEISMENPTMGSDSDNLPVPAQEVETGDSDHNVPNNMIDDEPAENDAPEADVEIEATADDVDQHVD
jgi:hypothetical protein